MKSFVDEVGLKLPIIQAPINHYGAQLSLVEAVCEKGCLGVYSADFQNIYTIKDSIIELTSRISKPFAVSVTKFANYKKADLADTSSLKTHLNNVCNSLTEDINSDGDDTATYNEIINIILDNPPPVVIFQNGIPSADILDKLKKQSVYIIGMAGNILEAITCDSSLVDAILLQGIEAPGLKTQFDNNLDTGFFPTSTLLHHALGTIKKPILVWGDFQEPSGVVSYLLNGASAVVLDTIFWTSNESDMPKIYTDRLIQNNEMTTVITPVFSGYNCRVQKNKLTKYFSDKKNILINGFDQYKIMKNIINTSIVQQNHDYMPIPAGYCSLVSRGSVLDIIEKYEKDLNDLIDFEV